MQLPKNPGLFKVKVDSGNPGGLEKMIDLHNDDVCGIDVTLSFFFKPIHVFFLGGDLSLHVVLIHDCQVKEANKSYKSGLTWAPRTATVAFSSSSKAKCRCPCNCWSLHPCVVCRWPRKWVAATWLHDFHKNPKPMCLACANKWFPSQRPCCRFHLCSA